MHRLVFRHFVATIDMVRTVCGMTGETSSSVGRAQLGFGGIGSKFVFRDSVPVGSDHRFETIIVLIFDKATIRLDSRLSYKFVF